MARTITNIEIKHHALGHKPHAARKEALVDEKHPRVPAAKPRENVEMNSPSNKKKRKRKRKKK
jgi:hypothetical protein